MAVKVMIVDDNDAIRESVEILFETIERAIITAASGSDCLRHLEAGFRGVILMDIMMPDMDGWDTIREIVANGYYEGNIIVMLTGKDRPDDKLEGIQEYVTDYMTKPFDPDELLTAIDYYSSLLE
jgi:DNA-binding response OmpR family regulator